MAFTVPNQASASNSIQAQLDSIDFTTLAEASKGNGIMYGFAVSQRGAGANMSVDVSHGLGFLNGYYFASPNPNAVENVSITTAHATLPRLDLVCINSGGFASVTAGTAAAIPRCPTYSSGVVVAVIYVAAAATSITTANCTDKRVILPNTYDTTMDAMSYASFNLGEEGNYFLYNNAGTATQQTVANHPGILRLTTAAGNTSDFQVYSPVNGRTNAASMVRATCIVRRSTTTAIGTEFDFVSWNTGFSNQVSCYIYNTGNWTFRTTSGGTSTITNTGVTAAANTWQQIDIIRDVTGWVACIINGVVRAWHGPTSNIPTSTDLYLNFIASSSANGVKDIDLDFIGMKYAPATGSRF